MGILDGMTPKKLIMWILLAIGIGIVLFILMLYLTLKTKTTSLERITPYKESLKRELVTVRPVHIFELLEPTKSDYTYAMSDTNQYYFQVLESETGADIPLTKLKDSIPAGATIYFENAVNYTNGVSGSSTPRFFGTISYKEKKYPIEFVWGRYTYKSHPENLRPGFTMDLAPWNNSVDTTIYYLPRGSF